jgi:cytochrome c oxidase assembly protein subunit 15
MLVLGAAILVALEALSPPAFAVPEELRRAGLVLVGAAFALLVTGTFATAAGPHSGGEDIRRFGNLVDAVHVHVGAAGAFGVGFLGLLAALVARSDRPRTELLLAAGVLAVLLAQVVVGEVQWHEQLPWGLVLVHVALATSVWTGMVALAVRLAPRRT